MRQTGKRTATPAVCKTPARSDGRFTRSPTAIRWSCFRSIWDSETVDTVTLDTDYQIDSISPYTEGKLLMIGSNYNVDPVETALLVYDTQTEEITELGKMPRDGYNTPSAICYDEARSKVYYVLSGSVWRMDISDDGFGTPEEFGDMPLESYSSSVAVMMGDWYILSSYDGVVGRDVTLDKMPPQRLRIINSNYVESHQDGRITPLRTSIRNMWCPSLTIWMKARCSRA